MANDYDNTSEKKLKLPEVLKWSQEQFKELSEMRRAFEQHMWQFPVAILGVVALLLNATKAFSGSTSSNPRLVVAILLLSFGSLPRGVLLLAFYDRIDALSIHQVQPRIVDNKRRRPGFAASVRPVNPRTLHKERARLRGFC